MSNFRTLNQLSRRKAVAGAAGLAASTTFGRVFAQTPAASPAAVELESPAATPEGNFAPTTGIEREEIIIGAYGLPDTLEPGVAESNTAQAVTLNIFETLVRRDSRNGGAFAPHLATAWTRESDISMVFRLRENVAFHNGEIMTADDVVFSFERIMNSADDSKYSVVKTTYIQTIASVEAIDDLTVRFTTHEPDPILLNRLAVVPSFIVNRKYVEEVGDEVHAEEPIGTGPFSFVSFTPGVDLVLARNENYWGQLSPVKNATFTVISETASRITALANQEVQIINNLAPDQVESVDASGVNISRSIPLANAHILGFNPLYEGLGDKRFRQALSLSIPREAVIEAIFQNRATHLHHWQYEDFGELYNDDFGPTPYDLERAQQLVEESDYNNEVIGYQLIPGYYTNNDQVGQIVVETWQSIGINAEVHQADAGKINPEEMIVHTWSNTNVWGDPAAGFWRQFGPGSNFQTSFWEAPEEFNTIGAEAEITMDVETRRGLYAQLTDIWYDEMVATDLYAIDNIIGVDATMNFEPNPLHALDLHAYNLSFNE